MSDDHAFLDLSILRTFSDGDVEMEKKLIGIFAEQSDKNMKTLVENRTNIDTEAWRETAHTLKGSSSSIGANVLAALCNEAQHFSGTADKQAALFEKIDREYVRVKDQLRKLGLLI